MTAAALLLSALLASAEEGGSAAALHAPVQTVDLATLTTLTARPRAGRFVFVPDSRPGLDGPGGCAVVEADGPPDPLPFLGGLDGRTPIIPSYFYRGDKRLVLLCDFLL
jgi:hypothetical protein